MDVKPCVSALDPSATLRIEDLIRELETRYAIVGMTHNVQQATCMACCTLSEQGAGELVEYGGTERIFT